MPYNEFTIEAEARLEGEMGTTSETKRTITLKVTAKGQVTLRKDVLDHLGIRPGEKVVLDKLPGGKISVGAEKKKGDIRDFFGSLKQDDGICLTIEEMNEVIASSWAGERGEI